MLSSISESVGADKSERGESRSSRYRLRVLAPKPIDQHFEGHTQLIKNANAAVGLPLEGWVAVEGPSRAA